MVSRWRNRRLDGAGPILVPSDCSVVEPLLERPTTEWVATPDEMIEQSRLRKTKEWRKKVAPLWDQTPMSIPSQHGNHSIHINLHRWRKPRPAAALKATLLAPVLWIHGGGMVLPSGSYGDPQLQILAPLGPELLIASMEYRLAPRHACPAAALDVIDALSWLHSQASALGADASRLGVLGESAGGNLAAVAALHAAQQPQLPVRYAVVFYPMVFNAFDTRSYSLFDKRDRSRGGLNKCGMEFYWRAYCPTAQACDDWHCTPLTAGLHRSHARSHPQTLVVSCSEDVLRDDGVRYHAALRDAGVDVRHVQVPGDHGCTHRASHADLAPLFEGLRRNLLSA